MVTEAAASTGRDKVKKSTNYFKLAHTLIIFGLATCFYFYENLLNVIPGAMKPELMASFIHSASEFASLSTYFLISYAATQIPAGILVDRFGPRRLLTVACACCGAGAYMFSQADQIVTAHIGRLFIGGGAGFALVCCLKLAIGWFKPRYFAFLTGLSIMVGYLGASVGLSVMVSPIKAYGWQMTMHWSAIFAACLTAAIWLLVRDKDPDNPLTVEEVNESAWKSLAKVVSNKQNWIASLYAALMYVPTIVFSLWAIPFLDEAHNMDRDTAGKVSSMLYVGWAIAAPLYGLISDYIGKRKLPMYVAAVTLLIVSCIIIYSENLSSLTMAALMLILGAASSSFILAFAVIKETNPASISGTAIGFTNTLNTLGGTLVQPIIGIILDLGNSVTNSNGEKIFTLADYQSAFIALPISIFTGLVLLFFVTETNCKSKVALSSAQ